MIADLLNHSGWRERLAACKVLSKVHTDINKDMRCKLLLCAWEDWSPAVRQAATQALGHTAHGKVDDTERIVVNCLSYLHDCDCGCGWIYYS